MTVETVYRLVGASSNLWLLKEELESEPYFTEHATIQITTLREQGDRLHSDGIAEILISVATGVSVNAIWAVLQSALVRARKRGDVGARRLEIRNGDEEDDGNSTPDPR